MEDPRGTGSWPVGARTGAGRQPRDYQPHAPGDLVPVDPLELRPVPGVLVKQFPARDRVSRWDVLEAHSRATASLAAQFEQACRHRHRKLFVLPPRSPQRNGRVERAQRTPPCSWLLPQLHQQRRAWERICNTVRPH